MVLISLCGNVTWKKLLQDNQQSLVGIVKWGMCVTESGDWYSWGKDTKTEAYMSDYSMAFPLARDRFNYLTQ